MNIIRFAIENPVKIAVASILTTLFGLLAIFEIPKQLKPDVDPPIVTVATFWPGASAQEVASEIVERQEEKLKNVSGLRKMSSTSVEGSATITLEFDVGVDKDIALRDASEKLRQVSGYPEEVNEPTISATDDDMSRTIAWIMLRGNDDIDISLLKTFVQDKVKPILERAEGIASVDVYGGRDREIQIRVDAHKLAARRLTFRQLESALRSQNANISAGTNRQGKRDYTFRTVGKFTHLKEIEDTVIAYQPGGPVLVRDVATVVDGFKKQYAFVRSKGDYVIAIPARREIGANVLTAMDNLKDKIRIVNEEVLPTVGGNLRLEQVYDETIYITSAIDLVKNNILIGGLLSVGVLLVFLRSASATGIIAVAIPLSVMGTFLVITLLGRSLNVVLLAGLAFAIGMVVDNAIVVLENIFRHRQMGKNRAQAAYDGASEVWGAVLASTLTTIAVFLPVIVMKEEAGQLFGDIAIAISTAVTLSLLVSVLVIPPLASKFLGTGSDKGSRKKVWFVARLFAGAVTLINRSTISRLLVIVGLTGASVYFSWLLTPDTDYLPAGNQNLVFGVLISPPGTAVEEFKKMANIVEEGNLDDPNDGLRPAWEAEVGSIEASRLPDVVMTVGLDREETRIIKPPPIKNFFFVAFGGFCFMGCTSKVDTVVSPLAETMSHAANRIPGVMAFFSQSSIFGRGMGGAASIEIEVRASDREKVLASAKALQRAVRKAGIGRPQADPANFDLGRPEVQIITNRAKAADLGLTVRDVGFIVEACVSGAFVGELKDEGNRIDMAIVVEDMEGATKERIVSVPVFAPSGHVVPLASATTLVSTAAPEQIKRIEEMEAVTISITPPSGTPLQAAMNTVRDDVIKPLRESGAIDKSVITAMAGNADKLTTTQRALIGDFRGTIVGPVWFGWSAGKTIGACALTGVLLILLSWLTLGLRFIVPVAWFVVGGLAIGFLLENPEFGFMLLQSRVALAVLITYLLMAALFESFVYPVVIMFSVPLAAVGGFVALSIAHRVSVQDITTPIQQLDILTMLGFVILLGVVVNNAILVVHQALNNMREHDMPADEAVAESVRTRTRPIFMSATTSIFGMAPLVVVSGAGSELYRGIGSVVVGGLVFSTVFTLLVVPAMFSLVQEFRAKVIAAGQPTAMKTSFNA
jgi:hydrophobic/amphiphilic exporter-1 (mainly G- bacteria), HAE1 family